VLLFYIMYAILFFDTAIDVQGGSPSFPLMTIRQLWTITNTLEWRNFWSEHLSGFGTYRPKHS